MHRNLEQRSAVLSATRPDVRPIRQSGGGSTRDAGIALCLSGGGYAGMLFTVGSLWRLNELGWLRSLDEIASVSAAAIASATLAAAWDRLEFDTSGVARRFVPEVVTPIRRLARETIDVWSIIGGEFSKRASGDIIADAYDECLFGGTTLQQLPDPASGCPRFVFTALDVFSSRLVWLSQAGTVESRGDFSHLRLAVAVSGATAFPPMMPPVLVHSRATNDHRADRGLALVEAGVCDSLALERSAAACQTLLVSDGNVPPLPDTELDSGWYSLATRLVAVVRQRDDDRRRHWLREVFDLPCERAERRTGTLWDARSELAFGTGWVLPYPQNVPGELAGETCRLEEMDECRQEQWINRGYAACAAALDRSDRAAWAS